MVCDWPAITSIYTLCCREVVLVWLVSKSLVKCLIRTLKQSAIDSTFNLCIKVLQVVSCHKIARDEPCENFLAPDFAAKNYDRIRQNRTLIKHTANHKSIALEEKQFYVSRCRIAFIEVF